MRCLNRKMTQQELGLPHYHSIGIEYDSDVLSPNRFRLLIFFEKPIFLHLAKFSMSWRTFSSLDRYLRSHNPEYYDPAFYNFAQVPEYRYVANNSTVSRMGWGFNAGLMRYGAEPTAALSYRPTQEKCTIFSSGFRTRLKTSGSTAKRNIFSLTFIFKFDPGNSLGAAIIMSSM